MARYYLRKKASIGWEWIVDTHLNGCYVNLVRDRKPYKAKEFKSREDAKAFIKVYCPDCNYTIHTLKDLVPGLKDLAAKYTQRNRQLSGAAAILTSSLYRMGYIKLAEEARQVAEVAKQTEAIQYNRAKQQLLEEHQDAKSRQ